MKPRHSNEVSKRFKRQNIILSVADSGVIEKITLKSVIIYESRLVRLTCICLGWMSAKSAILKILETTWVSRKIYRFFCCLNQNAKTSVQITFLTNLTGILLFLTYNHLILKLSLLAQNRWFFGCLVKAICLNEAAIMFNVGSPIWGGGGSIVLPT